MTEEKKKVLNRLRRTEGQIRGIQKMIDEEKESKKLLNSKYKDTKKFSE